MPYLNIQTNVPVSDEAALLAEASAAVAAMLGKPENYVMVHIESGVALMFAGMDAPAAYLQLKSLALPEAKTADYSATLCDLMQQTLGIEAGRVYIEFSAPDRHMWGWNSGTF
ncbi:MAG: phenylpyruvate tautomerase MIF-related protein [Mariprofundaceae bacterium]|nr:phenylpyruvate tautomerase MIF-related protein [Mariprofundaceae bacterium]